MNTTFELPQGFSELYRVNLQKDKKVALWVNVATVPIVFGMLYLTSLFDVEKLSVVVKNNFVFCIFVLAFCVLYIVLHELVHGIFIRVFSGKKASYRFTGLYACAGSNAYFNRVQYIIIALSPIIILGIVLTVALVLLPKNFFWGVYIVQIYNIAGAVGDLFITFKALSIKDDILVQDTGVEMVFFTKEAVSKV